MLKIFDHHTLSPIGSLGKSHGLEGRIFLRTELDLLAIDWDGDKFLFFELEGCFVPFRLLSLREYKDGYLVDLYTIDSKETADSYTNTKVWIDSSLYAAIKESGDFLYEDFKGFRLLDEKGSFVGNILDVDTSTDNIFISVRLQDGADEVLLPLAEELIDSFDTEQKELRLMIPEGLI